MTHPAGAKDHDLFTSGIPLVEETPPEAARRTTILLLAAALDHNPHLDVPAAIAEIRELLGITPTPPPRNPGNHRHKLTVAEGRPSRAKKRENT